MAKSPTTRRRHTKAKRRKTPAAYMDTVLDMLDQAIQGVVFGAGAVVLGRLLGPARPPSFDLPAEIPPVVAEAWRELAGAYPPAEPRAEPRPKPAPERTPAPDAPPVVRLVKGTDGVYRPE